MPGAGRQQWEGADQRGTDRGVREQGPRVPSAAAAQRSVSPAPGESASGPDGVSERKCGFPGPARGRQRVFPDPKFTPSSLQQQLPQEMLLHERRPEVGGSSPSVPASSTDRVVLCRVWGDSPGGPRARGTQRTRNRPALGAHRAAPTPARGGGPGPRQVRGRTAMGRRDGHRPPAPRSRPAPRTHIRGRVC